MDWKIWVFIIIILLAKVAITSSEEKKKREEKENLNISDRLDDVPKKSDEPSLEYADLKKESHKVAGVTHHMDAFYALRKENYDYKMTKREIIDCGMTDERIWQYEFYPEKTELVPEPGNPYDPHAIKVMVDGQHIGYIKKGSCAHVHNLIKSGLIEKISVEIGGGKYKFISFDDFNENGKEVYTSNTGSALYWAKITIFTPLEK